MPTPPSSPSPDSAIAHAAFENALSGNVEVDPNWKNVDGSTIDGASWNKLYPYQLIVVKKSESTGLYETAAFSPREKDKLTLAPGGGFGLKFTLPIPPQSLTISTPFAIQTTVTLGGIVEEHNAAPLRMISLSGTTGVMPLRQTGAAAGGLSRIFGGTINTLKAVAQTSKSLVGIENNPNLVPEPLPGSSASSENSSGTGYYQFRLLQQFLESYVTLKKKRENRDLRLAFCIWKDQAVYLVTPAQFDVSRQAGSPYEYNYNLSFRAWKRVALDTSTAVSVIPQTNAKDPAASINIMKKLRQARKVVQRAGSIPQAVRGDIDAVLEYVRQGIGLCKDVAGVAFEIVDLPASIIHDLQGAVFQAVQLNPNMIWDNLKKAGIAADKKLQDDIRSVTEMAKTFRPPEQGLSSFTDSKARFASMSYALDVLRGVPEIWDAIYLSDLDLTLAQERAIEAEKERLRKKTQNDFIDERDKIKDAVDDIADSLGLGSTTYDDAFGRDPRPQTRVATPSDFDVLFALNDVVTQFDKLAGSPTVSNLNVTSIDAVAGLAEASGLAFTRPVSKFAVPFPYNHTLEQVAYRYLGDPQRWLEIVALNGLSSPYVDEVGFTYELLVDGSDNEVVLDSKTNLFIGQTVWIESQGFLRTKRRITNITGIGPYAITVDGDANLSSFTVVQAARLRAYLPGTVNSSQTIYIPSQNPAQDEDFQTKAIPGVDYFDPLIQVGGIDLLVTGSGDLAMTPDGDVPLAYGLTNIVQKIKIALQTPKGSLIHFPDYGLGIPLGESTADVSATQIKATIQTLLSGDPTFDGIEGISVVKAGPTLSISFNVRVRGVDGLIPLSFNVTT